jgi:hypothetical protein
VNDASTAPPDLNLADSANNGQTITITVNSDGTLNISGTASSDDGSNVAGITNIIGNALATISLTGPDVANDWLMTGRNAGTLTPTSLTAITFKDVQKLIGGSSDDTFRVGFFNASDRRPDSIDGGSGTDTIVSGTDNGDVTLTDTSLTAGSPFAVTITGIEQALIAAADTANIDTTGFTGSVSTMNIPGLPDWISEGPSPITGGATAGLPGNPVSGAIDSVAPDPANANIIYVGTVGGGIWKTENAMAGFDGVDNDGNGVIDDLGEIKWQPLTDQFPSSSIPYLVFDPNDSSHQTLFAATGSVSSSILSNDNIRAGIYKTVNGGATWSVISDPNLKGKTVFVITPTTAVGDSSTEHVVLAGTEAKRVGSNPATLSGGLVRSTDGGLTFTKISGNASDGIDNNHNGSVDEDAEATGIPGGSVTSIVADPGDPLAFYAAVPGQWSLPGFTFAPADIEVSDTAGASSNTITLSAHGLTVGATSGPYQLGFENVLVGIEQGVQNQAPGGLHFGAPLYYLQVVSVDKVRLSLTDTMDAAAAIDLTSKGIGTLKLTRVLQFDPATGITGDQITIPHHGLTGTLGPFNVNPGTGTLPSGLSDSKFYYVHVLSNDTLELRDPATGAVVPLGTGGAMDASNPHPFSLDPIGGVFRTVDGGATWHAVSDGLNPLFLSLSVRMDLSVSQTKDSLQPNYPLYAAVIGPGSHGGELRR